MGQIDEQIEQCEKDLAAVQANLTKLKAEKASQTKLVPGDVVKNCWGQLRLIVTFDGCLQGFDVNGRHQAIERNFGEVSYEKIGRISDFIGAIQWNPIKKVVKMQDICVRIWRIITEKQNHTQHTTSVFLMKLPQS